MRIRENSELSLLTLIDMQSKSKKVMSHACIKANIKARKAGSLLGGGYIDMSMYEASGKILYDLIREGLHPEPAVPMDVSVATQPPGLPAAASSDDTAAPMQGVTQTAAPVANPPVRTQAAGRRSVRQKRARARSLDGDDDESDRSGVSQRR